MRLLAPLAALALSIGSLALACGGDDGTPTPDGVSPQNEAGTTSSGGDDGGGSSSGDSAAGDSSTTTTGSCTGKTGAAGNRTIEITVGGTKRSFDLHVPAAYDPTKATPLVFVFHGYTMSASGIATASKFAAAADKHRMIVAFPTGLNSGFNAGECCGASVTSKVDDLGFTRDMVSSISKEYCIDAKRIHSTGFSNGGFMSYYLACEMSETFASVASVAGTLGIAPDACKPKRPVALLHIHGTNDLVVPYNGGGLGGNRSVAASVQAFRTLDKCAAGDGTPSYTKDDVTCTRWACDAGTHVEHCAVANGGHQWPGGDTLPYGGSASPNLDSSEAIAKFFDDHPLP